ncbi:MAG: hypothetical protein ABSE63_14605 [Thermoguttaceae bacterium]|jgi:hypothetical protein
MPAKLRGSSAGVADYFLRKHRRIKRQLQRFAQIVVLPFKYPELFVRWLALLSLASSPACRAIDGQALQN